AAGNVRGVLRIPVRHLAVVASGRVDAQYASQPVGRRMVRLYRLADESGMVVPATLGHVAGWRHCFYGAVVESLVIAQSSQADGPGSGGLTGGARWHGPARISNSPAARRPAGDCAANYHRRGVDLRRDDAARVRALHWSLRIGGGGGLRTSGLEGASKIE